MSSLGRNKIYLFSITIARLRMAAKVTQRMYGTRSHVTALEIFANARIVKIIKLQRKIISTNARSGDLRPKNIIDHKALRINWIPKIKSADLTFLFLVPFL